MLMSIRISVVATDSEQPTIRAEHANRTRGRIVQAATDLVSERGDADFTMPEVADASGLSLRTLYRYFRTRQDLIDALATVADQAAASNLPEAAFDLAGLGDWLEQAWQNLLDHETFIRAQHSSPNGAAIRSARIPFFREVTRTLLAQEVPEIAPSTADDIVDTTLLLVSSSALFEFTDVLDVPVERAARLAATAIRSLVNDARRPD